MLFLHSFAKLSIASESSLVRSGDNYLSLCTLVIRSTARLGSTPVSQISQMSLCACGTHRSSNSEKMLSCDKLAAGLEARYIQIL